MTERRHNAAWRDYSMFAETIPQLFLAARRYDVTQIAGPGSPRVRRTQTHPDNAKTNAPVAGGKVSVLPATANQ